MKKMLRQRIAALGLAAVMLLTLGGCGNAAQAQAYSLTKGLKAGEVKTEAVPDGAQELSDFALRLLKHLDREEKNILLSPLSIMYALAMTANGADGNTLSQMEEALGLTAGEADSYLHSYLNSFDESDNARLKLAGSIWFNDNGRVEVKGEFLQKNVDYFNAEIYKAAFDETTSHTINGWVNEKTDSMVKEILDKVDSDAVIYLINALAFDADWQTIYKETQINAGTFFDAGGGKQDTTYMYSNEGVYIEDDNAAGLIKQYEGGRFGFAALLPDEGIELSDYIAGLSGNDLTEILKHRSFEDVEAAIPKFEAEYKSELSDTLKQLGMPDAFDACQADFSGMYKSDDPEENLFINRVLHKSFISVDERGTRAGAAAAVEIAATGAGLVHETKRVYLTRPFIYMIADLENDLPVFIGTYYGNDKNSDNSAEPVVSEVSD